jgi:hypothetical protein
MELSPFPLSSRAKPRDLRSSHPQSEFRWKLHPPLCHPDRSVAKWRDLQFSGPLLDTFFDRAKRIGETCCFPHPGNATWRTQTEVSSRPKRSAVEGPAVLHPAFPNRIVIGMESAFYPATTFYEIVAVTFVIPSEAEGSAVLSSTIRI